MSGTTKRNTDTGDLRGHAFKRSVGELADGARAAGADPAVTTGDAMERRYNQHPHHKDDHSQIDGDPFHFAAITPFPVTEVNTARTPAQNGKRIARTSIGMRLAKLYNLIMTNNRFLIFAVLAVALMRPQDSQARQAYLLDTAGLGDVGELYLIGALQGIVNRDAPRLFLAKGTANAVYVDYTHLSGYQPDHLQAYAEETSRGLHALGISPAVDVWDCFPYCSEAYEALSLHSPASEGVKLMSVLPGATNASETYWLDM